MIYMKSLNTVLARSHDSVIGESVVLPLHGVFVKEGQCSQKFDSKGKLILVMKILLHY